MYQASAEGEGAHEERDLKIKDLEEMKGQLKDLLGEIDNFKKAEMEQKATFDDMKETLRTCNFVFQMILFASIFFIFHLKSHE